ncbi:hypothetical protein BDN72DRAFT_798951 [Pluteus cervinus]|uniref:Uncharacterized protein n=1 Tax=Pluteus cervinus TaxID=181527 RepID=A0ACD3AP34_9AGAR|nr:hypothetical protein BDN72DRAFT_798951 [Pluteus cervinus]
MSIKPIIFYDIPSTLPGNVWSPNTWKARYALNYKKIPYKTEWVEYPDIASTCIRIGAPPTTTWKKDGSPYYTAPFIFDPNTNRAISDSIVIAQYLDEQYPDTLPLFRFPGSPIGLNLGVVQAGFVDAFRAIALANSWQFTLPRTRAILNPVSEVYFRRTREETFGKRLEDVVPKKETGDWDREWEKVKKDFEAADKWFRQHAAPNSGEWVLGDTLSFADLSIAGYLIWIRILMGEDSQYWKDITSWSGGRWGRFIERLAPYETVL